MSNEIIAPFPVFKDLDGLPLENGQIYIGEPNLDPVANPKDVFFDQNLSIAADQPIRTLGGYLSNGGAASRIYTLANYSMRILNKKGELIFSVANYESISSGPYNSIADLPKKAVDGNIIEIASFYNYAPVIKPDGGGGIFIYDATANANLHDGGLIIDPNHSITPGQAGWWTPETGTGVWRRLYEGAINIDWFGAYGLSDSKDAIQKAFDVAVSDNNIATANAHTYTVKSQITITADNFRFVGKGNDITTFLYAPASGTTDACILIKNSGVTIVNTIMSDFGFNAGANANGAAIEIEDVRHGIFERLSFDDFDNAVGTSCAVKISGRDNVTFRKIRATNCPYGFVLEDNPNEPTIDSDFIRFEDIFVNCGDDTNGRGWSITGTNNYNVAWSGSNSVNNSKYGIYLDNASVTGSSSQFIVEGVRVEQGNSSGGYGFYFNQDPGGDIQNISFRDCRVSTGQNGFYFRNIDRVQLDNCICASGTDLNFDTTVNRVLLNNFLGTGTRQATGHERLFIGGTGGTAFVEIYDTETPYIDGTDQVRFNETLAFNPLNGGPTLEDNKQYQYTSIASVADAALMSITPPSSVQGYGIVHAGDDTSITGSSIAGALFLFDTSPANNEIILLAANNATNSAGTASKLNIYGAGNIVRFENKLGSTTKISCTIWYNNGGT